MGANIPLPALHVNPPEDPLNSYAKAISIRGQRLQQEEQSNQVEQQQMAMKSQKAMMKAYQDANGDLVKATDLAAKYGAKPDDVIKLKQASIEQQKSNLELLNAKGARAIQEADMMQGAHDQVAAAPPEQKQAVYQQTLAQLAHAGIDTSQVPPQYPGDEAFNVIGIGLRGHKQQLEELAKQTEIDKNKAQGNEANAKAAEANASIPGKQAQGDQQVRANAASVLAASKDQADYEARRGQLPFAVARQFPDQFDKDAVLQSGMTPHEQASIPIDKVEMKDWLRKNPTKTPSDFAAWKASLAPAARISIENGAAKPITNPDGTTDVAATAKKFGMSQQAFDQTAEKYYQTGNLPPLGRGGIGLQRALMNRTAELHPVGDIAGNAAAFKANSESLKKLQTNFDQVSAFESTAKKNIDLLEATAKKIPDLGSRFANIPVRAVSGRMLGTEEMAAFKTALNTAQTEAAKVLNSSNASGVLSDSARHELQDIVDGNMSFKAMVASLNTLKKDMSNRHEAYSQQISDIQGRLKTKSAPAQGGGSGGEQQPITITLPSGKTVTIK